MILEVAAAVAAVAALGHGVRGRSSRMFGPNVWRGPRDKRQIALTFDDGPSEATPQVLDLLDLFCVRATFFQCGQNVARRPALARQVHDEGHEIGNHTYSHPRLIACSPARIREEIGNTQKAIVEATGVAPRWFRAPYGERWFGLSPALRRHGLTGVMWTVIGNDWEWEAAEIARHVVGHASNGGIVCLHDGDRIAERADRRNTVQALREMIPRLYERGYSFVTVAQMLQSGASGGAS